MRVSDRERKPGFPVISKPPHPFDPLKIVRVITRMNAGGPAVHVCLLAEGLEERGYQSLLVAGVCEEEQGDIPARIPPDLQMATVPWLSRSISPLRDLAALWSVYRLIRREKPSIVHTHTAKAGMVGRVAALLAGVPIIVHTFHGNSLRGYFSPLASAVFRRIERLLARITDRICVVSNQQLEEISGEFRVARAEKIRVIPLGLDLEAELRQPLPQLSDGVLRVGWIGRLVEIKGVPLLIATIEEAARRDLPIEFLVAGDGPERKQIQTAVDRFGSGRVRWSGWVRDICDFAASCHVLIQTSKNEGTPVALIQGMAAGRPFVSTAAGGVVDLVIGAPLRREGGCGWYRNGVLASADPISLASALEHFLSSPSCLEQMGSAARQFAAERFRKERLAADLDLLYRELLAGGQCAL
jgi:glycosyltransferase involved in cell wall biosynthesis